MLGQRRDATRSFTEGVGRVAVKLGLSANAVTLLGITLTAIGAVFIAREWWFTGGLIATFGCCMDFVDGAVARLTKTQTLRGGYLDSLLDRVSDFLLLGAILVALNEPRAWIVGIVALWGSTVTSFAKARVYQDVDPPADAWRKDLMERTERCILVLVAVGVQGFFGWAGRAPPILFWALVVLAVGSLVTVVQRMVTAWKLLGAPRDG